MNTERALKSNNYNDVEVGPKSLNKPSSADPKPLYEIRGIYADKEKWLEDKKPESKTMLKVGIIMGIFGAYQIAIGQTKGKDTSDMVGCDSSTISTFLIVHGCV